MAPRTSRSEAYLQEVAPFLEEWAEHGVSDRWQQFRNWSAQQVLWEYGLPFADIEEATRLDGPRDKGIDAWYFDDEYDPPRLVLIQAKDQQPKRDDFSKLKDGFLDVVLPGRPKGASSALLEKAALFREQMPKAFKVDVYLTTSLIAQQNLQPDEDGSPLYLETLQVGDSVADASYYVRDIKFLVQNIQLINSDPIDCTFHVDKNSRFVFDMGGTRKPSARPSMARSLPNSSPSIDRISSGRTLATISYRLPRTNKSRILCSNRRPISSCSTMASLVSLARSGCRTILMRPATSMSVTSR